MDVISTEELKEVLFKRYGRCGFEIEGRIRTKKYGVVLIVFVSPIEKDVFEIKKLRYGWKIAVFPDGTVVTPREIGASSQFLSSLGRAVRKIKFRAEREKFEKVFEEHNYKYYELISEEEESWHDTDYEYWRCESGAVCEALVRKWRLSFIEKYKFLWPTIAIHDNFCMTACRDKARWRTFTITKNPLGSTWRVY
ncbi:MAG: hypothetical protein DRO09_00400 [Thermoprotei archaeon]|nr:MAG: hypothetical protein DRO09_00400 [Thermoprotei archaeon]